MDIEVKKQEDPYKGTYTINLCKIFKDGKTKPDIVDTIQISISDKSDFMATLGDISLYNNEQKKTSESSTNKEEENYYFMKTINK